MCCSFLSYSTLFEAMLLLMQNMCVCISFICMSFQETEDATTESVTEKLKEKENAESDTTNGLSLLQFLKREFEY